MNYATESDIESNRLNKPGIAKLRILDKVITKLKSPSFSELFLDHDGLNILNKFIGKLPDGSYPLSNVRTKIFNMIYSLPCHIEHLRATDLGKTLMTMNTSPRELSENKKLIQLIRDKWSRLIFNINVEYTTLEQCERANSSIPFTYRMPEDEEEEVLGKRKEATEDEMNANLSFRNVQRPRSLGYNFSVRPSSAYNSVMASGNRSEDQMNLDKHLMRIRRNVKRS